MEQANMYSAGLVAMVMGEMADVADEVERRTNRDRDLEDVQMDEAEWDIKELQDRTLNDHDWIVQLQALGANPHLPRVSIVITL